MTETEGTGIQRIEIQGAGTEGIESKNLGTDGVPDRTDWRGRPSPIGVLTGAGVSTSSGIPDFRPDFRGAEGVWTRNPIAELSANIDDYLSDPELRIRSWTARRDNPARQAIVADLNRVVRGR